MRASSERDKVIYDLIWKKDAGLAKPSDSACQLAQLLKPGERVCDLGAGGGRHARLFASANLDVVAVDRNQQALKALDQVSHEYPNCQVVGDDILSFLRGCESTFDAIIMWDCVHHVVFSESEFDDLARSLRQHTADEGYLLITLLSDISYPDHLAVDDRYMLSREAAARQLQASFTHGWQLVLEKQKTFTIPGAEGLQGTSIVVGDYSATRLIHLYKAVPHSSDGASVEAEGIMAVAQGGDFAPYREPH
jgi:2-polyprenyl-3-methyl-5-hydroxy-6-metoxy-1,4-benzoquinol methylase